MVHNQGFLIASDPTSQNASPLPLSVNPSSNLLHALPLKPTPIPPSSPQPHQTSDPFLHTSRPSRRYDIRQPRTIAPSSPSADIDALSDSSEGLLRACVATSAGKRSVFDNFKRCRSFTSLPSVRPAVRIPSATRGF
ncbi:hypothetical protein DOTSEDRAFT_73565 [Dothistroma septosporum NZE10]|uniref:Uncharacterized protein n=1 Tax=Dothistroma septosporum (strain NZE10 / CBS 128990) TaxID=675120 RepID=N1PI26_DOTSN|nr:hypothetical protein DOTSEDRAFT_73565 [Dothistroma septosporum NZE10]